MLLKLSFWLNTHRSCYSACFKDIFCCWFAVDPKTKTKDLLILLVLVVVVVMIACCEHGNCSK